MNIIDSANKDAPLRDDIRLLGRILGDTIREQEGEGVFDIVERIRQISIRFHRDEEAGARVRRMWCWVWTGCNHCATCWPICR